MTQHSKVGGYLVHDDSAGADPVIMFFRAGAFKDSGEAKDAAVEHAAFLSGKSGELGTDPHLSVLECREVVSADKVASYDRPERPFADNDAEVRRLAEGGLPASEIDKREAKKK